MDVMIYLDGLLSSLSLALLSFSPNLLLYARQICLKLLLSVEALCRLHANKISLCATQALTIADVSRVN